VRVIDAHQHLGTCRVFDADLPAEALLAGLDGAGADLALVMPFPGAPDAAATHDAIAALGPRARGIVNLSPHVGEREYAAEARRCVRELGFVALKLHTVGHAVDPMSRAGERVFALAAELGVPVMVHTGGVGEPFSSPSHCLPGARAHPTLPVVLAHAGMGKGTREAGIVARECPNVFLETSWCSVLDTAWLLDYVGPERVMLGSDAPENLPLELAKFRALGLAPAALERCLAGTASEVFGL